MKTITFICVSILCCLSLSGQTAKDKHVILITIDGFRPDFYLNSEWDAPNLKKIAQEGAYCDGVTSVFPSITYPSHTTIVTGVQPVKHGVFFNGMFDPENSQTDHIYWNFKQITAPTLWQMVREAGLKTASLNWPVSAEAPVMFNIPDIGGRQEEIIKYAYPLGIIDTLNEDLFQTKGDLINLGKDQNSARIAAWAIKRYAPNFMSIHLFSVDHAEHLTGRTGKMVEEAIADADESIGIIRKAIDEAGIGSNTLLIVTGDHGFQNVNTMVYPNIWLFKAGLLENPDNNWKARFHPAGGSAFLFLKDKNDRVTLRKVDDMLQALPLEQKKFVRLITPAEASRIGANPNASLMISGLEGAAFGSDYTGDAIRLGKGGTHGYFPDSQEIKTGFLCLGGGVKAKTEIKSMNLRDVTAIVIQYLGISMPTSEGKVPVGLFGQQ